MFSGALELEIYIYIYIKQLLLYLCTLKYREAFCLGISFNVIICLDMHLTCCKHTFISYFYDSGN